jgi:hypothetical protein
VSELGSCDYDQLTLRTMCGCRQCHSTLFARCFAAIGKLLVGMP